MTSFGANFGGMTWRKGVFYCWDVDGSSSEVKKKTFRPRWTRFELWSTFLQFDVVLHPSCAVDMGRRAHPIESRRNTMACEYHKPADTMRKKEVGKITYIAKHAQRSDRWCVGYRSHWWIFWFSHALFSDSIAVPTTLQRFDRHAHFSAILSMPQLSPLPRFHRDIITVVSSISI